MHLAPPDPPLQMSGIALRLMRPEESASLFIAGQDPLIRRYMMSSPDPGDVDVAAWVQLQFQAWTTATARFAIAEEQSDQLVGSISLHVVGDTAAQVGYWIVPAHRRKGHATVALELVTRWSFDDLGLQLVSMLTDLDNEGSQRVAARAGFASDGIATNHELRPGVSRDVIVWSRSASG